MFAPERILSAAWKALLAAIFLLPLLCTVRLSVVPTEALVGNLLIDDAFYYVVPARNFVSGLGYSFDGETRTNGVQPLWAIICLLLTALLPEGDAVLHFMVFLSGILWIGAGWLLYRTLCAWDRWWAAPAALGWILTGTANRLAFQGMENGLCGFLFALCLAYAVKRLRDTAAAQVQGRFYLGIGLILALFTLARIDGVLLALILGVLVLFGLLSPRGSGAKFNLRGAVLLALPGICLCGGMILLSLWYFGDALPISGRAKMFYQSSHSLTLENFAGELRRQAASLYNLSLKPLTENLVWTLQQWRQVAWPKKYSHVGLLGMLIVGGLFGVGSLCRRRGELLRRPAPLAWFVAGWVSFAVLHFLVYSLKFSHFTKYGTWYFAPEIMLLWVCLAGGMVLCGRAIGALCRKGLKVARQKTIIAAWLDGLLPASVAAIMLLAALIPLWHLPPPEGNRNPFLAAARWMAENLPAGSKIGCFSAGIVGYFAAGHQVVNLDGLMNDRHYLEEYLKKGRVADYVRLRQLDYFADYSTIAGWRSNRFWGLDLRKMQLVFWRPMAGDLSYAIWRILPQGESRDVLDPCFTGPCERLMQIHYAAEVLERFETLSEEQLEERLQSDAKIDKRVITSFYGSDTLQLRHVLVTESEAAQINLKPADIKAALRRQAVFGDGLRLLGVDVSSRRVRRGERFFLTRYWVLEGGKAFDTQTQMELWLRSAPPGRPHSERLWHCSLPCYGTYPLDRWRHDEAVVETYGIWVTEELTPGTYALELRIRSGRGEYLPVNDCSQQAEATGFWLMNLEIL